MTLYQVYWSFRIKLYCKMSHFRSGLKGWEIIDGGLSAGIRLNGTMTTLQTYDQPLPQLPIGTIQQLAYSPLLQLVFAVRFVIKYVVTLKHANLLFNKRLAYQTTPHNLNFWQQNVNECPFSVSRAQRTELALTTPERGWNERKMVVMCRMWVTEWRQDVSKVTYLVRTCPRSRIS